MRRRFVVATRLSQARSISGWEFQPGNRALVEEAVVSLEHGPVVGRWTPGDGVVRFPPGIGVRLPPRSRIVFDVRYRKSATPQMDQSAVALYFARAPGRPLQHRTLPCGATRLEQATEALALTPLLPAAGESVEIVAALPDGSVEPLCVIPRYEPGYPVTYRFRRGVRLQRGTVVQLRSSSPECSADLSFVAVTRGPRPGP